MNNRRFGWIRQLPDFRDYKYQGFSRVTRPLPKAVSLQQFVTRIYDQEDTFSCTANAIAQAVRITQQKNGLAETDPSRLFIYFNERLREGTVSTDNGADLRDGMKVAADLGVAYEADWPFDVSKIFHKPTPQVYQNAVQNMVKIYAAVNQDLNSLKQCLIDGFPFVFGFTVYDSFESDVVAATGNVPLPKVTEKVLGGHAVCAVGYDDDSQTFTIANSWGPDWGQAGFFKMPYEYILNTDLSSDFWAIMSLELANVPTRKWRVPK